MSTEQLNPKKKSKKDPKVKSAVDAAVAAFGKTKKRKDTPSDAVGAAPATPPKKLKKQKQESVEAPQTSDGSDDTTVEHVAADKAPEDLDNFRLSPKVKELLRKKGIQTLFPIQQATLDHGLNGEDVVGRARTGCGKTLAFVLPIIERLGAAAPGGNMRKQYGRAPSVIVLAPTRELAKQVAADFEYLAPAVGLSVLCVYGGAPWGSQEGPLRKGVDVVVGTPGRVKDFMERGTLNLKEIKYRVLDECDEMLSMGFVEDVEKILTANPDSASIQTMLFSATLPGWVKQITRQYLKPTHKTVDLIGDEKVKASTSVRHMLLPCHWQSRDSILADVLRSYGCGGRTIVFTETKNDANELVGKLSQVTEARALHGDIPQAQREVTLEGFRRGRFRVLVATDVAARGLDISGVELVVQAEPPKEAETYIHRSGRTGRANNTGISVTLVAKRKEYMVPLIERKGGFKFERIGPPQAQDMARVAGERAVEAIKEVQDGVIDHFRAAAQQLLAHTDGDAEKALALTLAHATGHMAVKSRSLLCAQEEWVTLQYTSKWLVAKPGYVYTWLKKKLAEDEVEQIKRVQITADEKGAVFDVAADKVKLFMDACALDAGVGLSVPTQLPPLKEREGEAASYGGNGHQGYGSKPWNSRGGSGGGRGGYAGRGGQQGYGSRGRGGRGGSWR